MGLESLKQQDLSAGMWRSLAAHRIPQNGCWDLTDFLIDNQGLPYERGGIGVHSGTATSSNFTVLYDALLSVGRRTFWATTTEMGVLDPADGVTPITIDDATGFLVGIPSPRRATVVGGRMYIDGGLVYGGATKAAEYSTGTVAMTKGSTTVVGTGTSWAANLGPGMILNFPTPGENYVVASVTDNTHLELTAPFKGATASGLLYAVRAIGASITLSDIYGTAGRRLLALGDRRGGTSGDTVHFSRNQDPINEITRSDGSFEGIEMEPDEDPENFQDGDFHQIPNGPEGLGIASWGDTAIIFTTDGVWLISNMDLQPVDSAGNMQQQLTHNAPQVVLWHRNGLAPFENAWVVPARDGIYIMGPDSLERVDTPITPLYRDYQRQGLTLGLATVVEGHYLLPILSGINYVDTLVCRLDRPVRTSAGTIRPWSHFSGLPVRAFCRQETAGAAPKLLVASTGNKILRARYFEPAAVDNTDNGTVFNGQIVTRDYPTGNGNQNLVRGLDVDYDLTDSASYNPTLTAEFATTHPVETASYTSAGTAGSKGSDQLMIRQFDNPPRSRYVRFRIRSVGRLSSLLIRSLNVWVRGSTKHD